MSAQQGRVWPLVLAGIPQPELFQDFLGEGRLGRPCFREGESSNDPALLDPIVGDLFLLEVRNLEVDVKIFKEIFNFGFEGETAEKMGELPLSQVTEEQEVVRLDFPPEISAAADSLGPGLELQRFYNSLDLFQNLDDPWGIEGDGDLLTVLQRGLQGEEEKSSRNILHSDSSRVYVNFFEA